MTLEGVIREARSIARLQFGTVRPTDGQVLETLAEIVSAGRAAYLAERKDAPQLTGMCERCARNHDEFPLEREVSGSDLALIVERLRELGPVVDRLTALAAGASVPAGAPTPSKGD